MTDDIQSIKDIAALQVELANVKIDMIHMQEECRKRDEEQAKRITTLEAYKVKTERYGWFLSGVFAVGVFLAATIEGWAQKINTVLSRLP